MWMSEDLENRLASSLSVNDRRNALPTWTSQSFFGKGHKQGTFG